MPFANPTHAHQPLPQFQRAVPLQQSQQLQVAPDAAQRAAATPHDIPAPPPPPRKYYLPHSATHKIHLTGEWNAVVQGATNKVFYHNPQAGASQWNCTEDIQLEDPWRRIVDVDNVDFFYATFPHETLWSAEPMLRNRIEAAPPKPIDATRR